MTKIRIINRVGPCRCGCQGRDPWHRSTFDRVIRNVRWGDNLKPATLINGMRVIEGVINGEARLPWGVMTLTVTAFEHPKSKQWIAGGWHVEK